MEQRKKKSFTLSSDAAALLVALAAKLGISMTAVLEISIREKAGKENITLPDQTSR